MTVASIPISSSEQNSVKIQPNIIQIRIDFKTSKRYEYYAYLEYDENIGETFYIFE